MTETGETGNELSMLKSTLNEKAKLNKEGGKLFIRNITQGIALTENEAEILEVLDLALIDSDKPDNWWSAEILSGLRNGLNENDQNYSGLKMRHKILLENFSPSINGEIRRASIALLHEIDFDVQTNQAYLDKASQVVLDRSKDLNYREDALLLLRLDLDRIDYSLLQQLINPVEAESFQKLAIRIYSDKSGQDAAEYYINNWQTFTPSIRNEMMRYLVMKDVSIQALISALEANKIQKNALTWSQKVRLMNHRNPDIKRSARALLDLPETSNEELLNKFSDALAQKGELVNGAEVFKTHCSACHQVNGANGIDFGPDLGSIRNREKRFILNDIINPNQSIADGYNLLTITMKSEEVVTGIITSETPTSIAVRYLEGTDKIIPRVNITGIQVIEASAMPEGLGGVISGDEMTDLLSFLKSEK